MEKVRDDFLASLDSLLDVSDFDDPYSATEVIDEVEAVASSLGLDISREAWRAREEADAIRPPEDEDVRRPPPSPAEPVASGLTDDEIDEMFGAL